MKNFFVVSLFSKLLAVWNFKDKYFCYAVSNKFNLIEISTIDIKFIKSAIRFVLNRAQKIALSVIIITMITFMLIVTSLIDAKVLLLLLMSWLLNPQQLP